IIWKGLGALVTRDIPPRECFHVEEPLLLYCRPDIPSEQELELLYIRFKPGKKEIFRKLRVNEKFLTKLAAFNFNEVSANDGVIQLNAMFITASRFNHSCLPSASVGGMVGKNGIEIHTIEPIAKGDEITICYNSAYNYVPAAMRYKHQLDHYQFVCSCGACQTNTPFGKLSSMRRHLLHGLLWLSLGPESVPG
ncbi:MAG: hypothetical protein MMC33_010115, partial [Icmadophila ericetorum]|nr:hypothetical protein [Icmadophila ericetorum]